MLQVTSWKTLGMAVDPPMACELALASLDPGPGAPTKRYLKQLPSDKRAFVRAQHMLHFPIRLYLQNTNSKLKLLRISGWQSRALNPKCGISFWAQSPVQLHWLHAHETGAGCVLKSGSNRVKWEYRVSIERSRMGKQRIDIICRGSHNPCHAKLKIISMLHKSITLDIQTKLINRWNFCLLLQDYPLNLLLKKHCGGSPTTPTAATVHHCLQFHWLLCCCWKDISIMVA